MHRGNCRRTIAIGMLTICLALATPLTADARWFELDHREGVASSGPSQEIGWWERIWTAFESLWGESVFIIPEGNPGDGSTGG